jgi:hypothetical protein
MADRHATLDRDRRNEAINGRSDGHPAPSALPINLRSGKVQTQGRRIGQNWERQESLAKLGALRNGPKPLQNLLHHRPTGHKTNDVLLPDGAKPPAQEFYPYRRIYQDHLDRRVRRGRSSRISLKSPFQIFEPKNAGRLWIFLRRITSASAIFTADEYVFADRILVASWRSSSSSTRFVRFMCIVYRAATLLPASARDTDVADREVAVAVERIQKRQEQGRGHQ